MSFVVYLAEDRCNAEILRQTKDQRSFNQILYDVEGEIFQNLVQKRNLKKNIGTI